MIINSDNKPIVLNPEIIKEQEERNLYFAYKNYELIYPWKAQKMANKLMIDDVKISLIRNKGLARYQELPDDNAKAEFRRQVNDALILLRAFAQGTEIGRTIEMDEASETRKDEIRKADLKYVPKKRPNVEAKGLEGKAARLGIDFSKLMDEVRKA